MTETKKPYIREFTPKTETSHVPETKTEHKEWWEVERKHEVCFVGDVNGSHYDFLKNARELGLVEFPEPDHDDLYINPNNVKWIGNDKKLVVLGDILGDRHGEGDSVLRTIQLLKEQGANIEVIAGNHDIAAFIYLYTHGKRSAIGIARSQGPCSEYEDWFFEDELLPKAQANHIKDIIDNYKLLTVQGDTLFVHGNFSYEEFLNIYNNAIKENASLKNAHMDRIADYLNQEFTTALKEAFLCLTDINKDEDCIKLSRMIGPFGNAKNGDKPIGPIQTFTRWPAYRYTGPNNTPDIPDERLVKLLKTLGINQLVFGHSTNDGIKNNDTFQMVSAGCNSGIETQGDNDYSYGKIEKTGKIEVVNENKTHPITGEDNTIFYHTKIPDNSQTL